MIVPIHHRRYCSRYCLCKPDQPFVGCFLLCGFGYSWFLQPMQLNRAYKLHSFRKRINIAFLGSSLILKCSHHHHHHFSTLGRFPPTIPLHFSTLHGLNYSSFFSKLPFGDLLNETVSNQTSFHQSNFFYDFDELKISMS